MNRWQRRIERAEELARAYPVSAELLHFYQEIARFQSAVHGVGDETLEPLLEVIRRTAPEPLALAAHLPVTWDQVLASADPMHAFFARVVLQARADAERAGGSLVSVLPVCPVCGEKPVAAVVRRKGRFLMCSQCLGQWEFRRMWCPSCGEEDRDQLPVFTAAEFPHVTVEACETCKVYVKSVDVTVDERAVPEVDELASIALDLWSGQRGFVKLQANLFGV